MAEADSRVIGPGGATQRLALLHRPQKSGPAAVREDACVEDGNRPASNMLPDFPNGKRKGTAVDRAASEAILTR